MNRLIIIIFLLLSTLLQATIYEDAEDNKTNRWILYSDTTTASIKNIYDKKRESRVIFLDSQDNQNGYMLAMERDSTTWCKTKGKSLRWSMRADRHFVILVSIQTKRGHRYIIYTSGDSNGRGYYGLGSNSVDGEWHKFSRDLDLDLKRYEPSNQIIAVDSFFVRGSMMIDDVAIVDIEKRDFIPKKLKSCNIKIPKINQTKKSKFDIYDNEPPTIKLNGYSTLSIKLGEKYIEQGATAIDNIDGSIPVEISEEVDSNRVGTYTLFYMAKDRVGNSAITTRIVSVGVVRRDIKKKKQNYIDATIEEELATLESIEGDNQIQFPGEDD
jgi:hypothetical protein